MTHETTFGTLRLRPLSDRVLISGPRLHLSALKKHLELCGIRPAPRRDPWDHSVCLEVEGPKAERVQQLVDEWTH